MSSCHYCLLTKSLQSCPALCNPMDCSPSGSSVHGSLKARILEWIAISFFRDSFPPRDWTCVSWVSYIAGSFFTTSTTWECQHYISINQNKNKNRKQQDKPVPSLLLAPCNEGWLPLVFIIVHAQSLSHVQLFETPWTIACQAPLSMGLSRQEFWSGLSFPPPWYLPYPGIEHVSPVSAALTGKFFTTSATWGAQISVILIK